jgi:hypothetical protein
MKARLKGLTPPRLWEAARAVRVRFHRLGYRRARWPRPLGSRPPIALAVCAIFRDEARYLAEWVSFHRIQGVERFYLYDNRSTDDWRSELWPEIEAGIVEVQHWPFVPAGGDRVPPGGLAAGQSRAYDDCLRRHRTDARWIAFIDIDEFLFSPTGRPLPEVLRGFDTHPGVVANWRIFGTSGWEEPPEGLVIENYLMRAPDEYNGHRVVKSIVNPRSVAGPAGTHHFRLLGDAVGEDGRPLMTGVTEEPTAELLRINHYFTRSQTEFERKGRIRAPDSAARGVLATPPNAIRDETILQFAPQLRELLAGRDS